MVKRTIGIRVLMSLGIVGLLMLIASPAMAVKITVNSTDDVIADDGKCTLREAVIAANTDTASGSIKGECQAGIGADTIVLQGLVYFLTIEGTGEDNAATGDLDILDDLTITGKSANKTFINGGKIDRVFHVLSNLKVNFKGVTIQNGLSDYGGGILNNGTLTITNSTVSNNMASAEGDDALGGGIYNSGALTITNSTVSNNMTLAGAIAYGGGIFNGGTLTITNSTVSNNMASAEGANDVYGGGIYNWGTLTISNSTVSNNMASGLNALSSGIYNIGILTITNSTVSNNMASAVNYAFGGGIYNVGTLTITKSAVSNNMALGFNAIGGGINSENTLTITKSTVSNNMASAGGNDAIGGGISNSGILKITKSTVSNNMASAVDRDALGGGIYTGFSATLTIEDRSRIFSNFSSDSGGGLFNDGPPAAISANSKVFRNIPDDIDD